MMPMALAVSVNASNVHTAAIDVWSAWTKASAGRS